MTARAHAARSSFPSVGMTGVPLRPLAGLGASPIPDASMRRIEAGAERTLGGNREPDSAVPPTLAMSKPLLIRGWRNFGAAAAGAGARPCAGAGAALAAAPPLPMGLSGWHL